jgi:hypothetical protein
MYASNLPQTQYVEGSLMLGCFVRVEIEIMSCWIALGYWASLCSTPTCSQPFNYPLETS